MQRKRRITVTVDDAVYRAALLAVKSGRAESVSGWVNHALARQRENDERLANLRELVEEYQAEHGAFTAEELEEQERLDREAAAAVRARRPHRRAG